MSSLELSSGGHMKQPSQQGMIIDDLDEIDSEGSSACSAWWGQLCW